ncbi:hypothetical protein ACOMHN_022892 [Nucella lapillus]
MGRCYRPVAWVAWSDWRERKVHCDTLLLASHGQASDVRVTSTNRQRGATDRFTTTRIPLSLHTETSTLQVAPRLSERAM